METAAGLELAKRDEDMRDDRSVISMPEGWAPAEEPSIERPADAMAAPKARAAAYAALHPDRDHDERPLTENERGGLRRATHQLCAFRAPTASKDTSTHPHAMTLFAVTGRTPRSRSACSMLFIFWARRRQDNANVCWRDLVLHSAPAFPQNILVCPQREEVQLTARLCQVTPREFAVEPPYESDDEQ